MSRVGAIQDKSARYAENINDGFVWLPCVNGGGYFTLSSKSVPVGDDQKQHLPKITRDIADRFNALCGNIFYYS